MQINVVAKAIRHDFTAPEAIALEARMLGRLFPSPRVKLLSDRQERSMQSATFRKWLAEHGCRFDLHEHKRGEGPVLVTVHREGRKSEVPLGGSRQDLDPREVQRACEELGLDWNELPNK